MVLLFVSVLLKLKKDENVHRYPLCAIRGELLEREREKEREIEREKEEKDRERERKRERDIIDGLPIINSKDYER